MTEPPPSADAAHQESAHAPAPGDTAEVASLLAGPGHRVTGQVLHVNGGTVS